MGNAPAAAATIPTSRYCAADDRRIVASNTKEQRLPKPPETECERRPDDTADHRHADHLRQHQRTHVSRLRAERHADPYFPQSLCDAVGEHGIEANRGQHYGNAGK